MLVASSQPEYANEKLLFTRYVFLSSHAHLTQRLYSYRGHMAFFRNSPSTLTRFLSFRKFSSFTSYMDSRGTLLDAEESEFSHYIFSEDHAFTFMTFEAMENSFNVALMVPGDGGGVYYAPRVGRDEVKRDAGLRRRLVELAYTRSSSSLGPTADRHTFSSSGVEVPTPLYTSAAGFEGENFLWFDKQYASYVRTGWVEREEREAKHYIMRREAGGEVLQRWEERERWFVRAESEEDERVVLDECLYKHWQEDKRRGKSFAVITLSLI